jgi:pimeloyl-ACP methyl ester carboxylesterase
MVFPMGTSAFYDEVTDLTTITATLDVQDPGSAIVDFYGNRELDPTGYGEGEWYFGEAVHVGDGIFELQVPGKLHLPMLSATATDSEGSTSEFGPRPPLILIPGTSGSRLVALKDANELWPGEAANHYRLELYPGGGLEEQIVATDIIRYEYGFDIYGSLIEFLEKEGEYQEYDVKNLVDRRTTANCDVDQRSENPNLFIFAYDWRLDIQESAEALQDYVGCIQRFFPGSNVDILAHSGGGLVSRKYMIEYPGNNSVNKLITIGIPWLGAPKMILVLATGDLYSRLANQLIWRSTMRYVAGSFTGFHQHVPGLTYYDDLGSSPLIEAGRDLNGNGSAFDWFSYPEYINVIDSQLGIGSVTPATTSHAFHATTGQDDWRADRDGRFYFSLVGIQDGGWRTIGKVASIIQTTCFGLPDKPIKCWEKEAFSVKPYLTEGDKTVPRLSFERTGWVPANAHEVLFFGSQFGGDDAVEHSALKQNPYVRASILGILSHGWDLYSTGSGSPVQSEVLNGSSQPPPLRYLTVSGASTLQLVDADGNEIRITEDTVEGSVPGVDRYILGERISLFILPISGEYTVTVDPSAEPLYVELTQGTGNSASFAQRYTDLSLPTNSRGLLTLSDSGEVDFLYDRAGDGDFDTLVQPTVSLTGQDANDLEPPEINVFTTEQGADVILTIGAVDQGSGVDKVYYSLNGEKFLLYESPLTLDRDQNPFITIFADDHAANRRTLVYDVSKPQQFFTLYIPLTVGGD